MLRPLLLLIGVASFLHSVNRVVVLRWVGCEVWRDRVVTPAQVVRPLGLAAAGPHPRPVPTLHESVRLAVTGAPPLDEQDLAVADDHLVLAVAVAPIDRVVPVVSDDGVDRLTTASEAVRQ